MGYTREQLIKAQHKYNSEWRKHPEKFNDDVGETIEDAENQIDYLLSLVE